MSAHPGPELLLELDGLDTCDRNAVLEHVANCAVCREVVAAEDPSRLFALLARHPIPGDLLDDVSTAVMAGIDSETQAAPAPSRSRRLWAVGAWAAGILLAAALSLVPRVEEVEPPQGPVDSVPRATVMVLESPGQAQVVDLALGETQVVMIFDQELEL